MFFSFFPTLYDLCITVALDITYKTSHRYVFSIKNKVQLCSFHWPEKVTEEFKMINRNEYFSKNGDI